MPACAVKRFEIAENIIGSAIVAKVSASSHPG
jgi:hypothetical protein